jgi:parallel beta-helix repeat protein
MSTILSRIYAFRVVAALSLAVPRVAWADDPGEVDPDVDLGRDLRDGGHGHPARVGWLVDCDRGDTIADALEKVQPGETLLITGICAENVEVGEAHHDITLDGRGTGVIRAPDPTVDALYIYADEVTVTGLTVSGGRDGINLRGAQVTTIVGNVVENNASIGIDVHRLSWATIKDNIIRNNGAYGIMVYENSIARIGFTQARAATPNPNLIEGNGGTGVVVQRSSHADIGANIIRKNGGAGIVVDMGSHAVARANDISQNTSSGISVTNGSGMNLSTGSSDDSWPTRPNFSSLPNGRFSVACDTAGFIAGKIGGVIGSLGLKSFNHGCVDVTQ